MKMNRKKQDIREISIKSIPYLILLGLSFISLYVFFYDGLLQGDDIIFHLANISDEYLSLLNQGSISRISTYLGSNLGIGTRLFYSPLFHLLGSLMYVITHWMGGNAVTAIKIVMFISVFVSGLFMYRFLLKASNGKIIAATIGAAIYVLYPYRIFDALCRAAYAEALAFVFIPLFFKGLHGLVNFKDEIKVLPYIEVIFGGALLFLSHNLTAIFGFVFGIIFLLANNNKIIALCRKPKYWISGIVSIFIMLGFMSISMFSSLELLNSGLYNISDAQRMWTTLQHVTGRIDTAFNYSGFLNYVYMNGFFATQMGPSILTTQIVSFLLLSFLFFFFNHALRQFKKMRHLHFPISAGSYLGLMFAFANRLEVILGAVVVIVLSFFIDYILHAVKSEPFKKETIYKDIDFWFLIGILILTFALITQKWIWQIVPEPFLMIQFPWRLFAYVQFFISWAIGLLCYKFEFKKAVSYAAITAIGFCLVTNQALPEKRLNFIRSSEPESTIKVYYGNEDYFFPTSSIGWNKEYIPQVFFQEDYVSEYSTSLYNNVKQRIMRPYQDEYPLEPVVLSGSCDITITERVTPNYTMDIQAADDSLIQMPLIFYPGYRIQAYGDNGIKTNLDALNVDGLIAFNVNEDYGQIVVSFVGSPLVITSYVYFGISILGVAGLVTYFKFFDRYKKKNL
ncbi:MAG: hypothetical protein WC286_04180 [Bacilli bacterium]|jgi:hypothetical protein|nr:hypothetical protein [Bacilli bacterium]